MPAIWGAAIGALGSVASSAIGGSGPSGQTTQTQSKEPWLPWATPMSNLYGHATNYLQNGNLAPGYFPGQSYAGPTSASTNALNSIIGNQQAGGLVGTGANALQQTAGGAYTQGGTQNPFFQGAFQGIADQIRPGIDSGFEAGGRYGSGAADNARASALTNAGMQMGFSNYDKERQNQLNAATALPAAAQASYMPYQMQLGAGQQQQADQQAAINDQMTRYNYEQNRPLMELQNYQSLLGSNPGGGQMQNTSPYFMPSMAQNAIGGALGGASIARLMSGTTGQQPVAQTNGGGGIFGGLGSYFGLGGGSPSYTGGQTGAWGQGMSSPGGLPTGGGSQSYYNPDWMGGWGAP